MDRVSIPVKAFPHEMQRLFDSCGKAIDWPKNLIQPGVLNRVLTSGSRRLRSQSHRLFIAVENDCRMQKGCLRQAAVDLLDVEGYGQGSTSKCATDIRNLKEILRPAVLDGKGDPLCRFISIHAPHSRAPLDISYEMFAFLLSWHQIAPSFLDFVLPFGKQVHAQDFYFSGFREESQLGAEQRGFAIPQMGRSGQELRICYNLRSVEHVSSESDLAWSIRQCAIYHSFDLETGRMLWINIKGNTLIKERMESEMPLNSLTQATSRHETFSASLSIHLILCDWARENWRWYINDLEDMLQQVARGAVAMPVDKLPTLLLSPTLSSKSPQLENVGFQSVPHFSPQQSPNSLMSRSSTFTSKLFSRTTTLKDETQTTAQTPNDCHSHDVWAKAGVQLTKAKPLRKLFKALSDRLRRINNSLRIEETSRIEVSDEFTPTCEVRQMPPEQPPNLSKDDDEVSHENFHFGDLQRVQYIEEKTQDALLHLRLDVEILDELRHYYLEIVSHGDFPEDLKTGCANSLAHFDKMVVGVVKDLKMIQVRIDTLLQLLANRKILLNSILQYRSVKANETFARKAQASADTMEVLTLEMRGIAEKTERETVSMRVITSVTLFFLPATFLASFMSTDIIDFKEGKQDVQIRGLRLYLAIALPATALAFLAWYVIYCVAKKVRKHNVESLKGGMLGPQVV